MPADSIETYFNKGQDKAYALPNRGPIKYTDNGKLHPEILNAYWRYGFYVLEGVISPDEVTELVRDFETVMDRAPAHRGRSA